MVRLFIDREDHHGFGQHFLAPNVCSLFLHHDCEEPPKSSRLNRVIIYCSTQLKRNNPSSPGYAIFGFSAELFDFKVVS